MEINLGGNESGDRSDEHDRFQNVTHRKKTTRTARRVPEPVQNEAEIPSSDATYDELRKKFSDIDINEEEIDPELSEDEQEELC